ncbi:MAG: histidine kinase dimerization/phospho-acceptor domain-containing protein [Minicystis sp.]
MSPPSLRARLADRRVVAELAAAGWELFSALLFASAVVPAASRSPLPSIVLVASLAVSAAIGPSLHARGPRGHAIAAAIRAASWPIAAISLLPASETRVVGAALVFGLMAAAVRRVIYRGASGPPLDALDDAELSASLRARLAEAAMVAGIVGGHVMLLFSVAFLRTQSRDNFETWFFVVPALALPATLGFTFVVRFASIPVVRAIAAGPSGDRALLTRGLARAEILPTLLAYLNFMVWFVCTTVGIFRQRPGPGPSSWNAGDAVLELGFASLFSWGVAFYQRAFHRETVAVAVGRLRLWTSLGPPAEPIPLGRRMLRDFGLPLIFTCLLSLLSSIGLYRALGSHLSAREDINAVSALFAAFGVLVLAVGGVVVRAARDLSRPMVALARAANRVAHGELEAAVPEVVGPVEVVTLGERLERMRERLARTIVELEEERAGLEANVAARTAELTQTLDELKRTQAALIQGERLASIGELVAGVAHEINNPLNAIAGAAVPLVELVPEVREMLDAYRAAEADLPPARRQEIEALRKRLDLDASLDDLTGISTVIRRAVNRSVKIVQNLRSFSRVSTEPVPTDLHVGLEETLMLLAPRLRQANVQIVRRLGEIPEVVCRGGENQPDLHELAGQRHPGVGRGQRGGGRYPGRSAADDRHRDPVRGRRGGRQRDRQRPGRAHGSVRQDLQSLLHHQAAGAGHGPRALDFLGHRPPARGIPGPGGSHGRWGAFRLPASARPEIAGIPPHPHRHGVRSPASGPDQAGAFRVRLSAEAPVTLASGSPDR